MEWFRVPPLGVRERKFMTKTLIYILTKDYGFCIIVVMKENIITTILGLVLAISFYWLVFLAVDPDGDWGTSLTFASVFAIVYAFSKNWGDEEDIDENS